MDIYSHAHIYTFGHARTHFNGYGFKWARDVLTR